MTPETRRPRRTQQERRSEAEQRLVAAAAELISEGGPSSLTLAKVGERAGYSNGLASHYFGSKGALISRVAEAVSQQFHAAMTETAELDRPLLDATQSFVGVFFDVLRDPLPINRARLVLIADAIAHEDSDSRDVMVDYSREFREQIAIRLQAGIDAGELDATVDANALAAVFVGLLRGIAFELMLDPTIDLAACRAEVEAFVVARFAPPSRPIRTRGRTRT